MSEIEKLLNVSLLPKQKTLIDFLLFNKPTYVRYLDDRKVGKSFSIAVYILSRILHYNEDNIIVTSSCFRNSKEIAEKCNELFLRIAQSYYNNDYKYTRNIYEYKITYKNSKVTFLPLTLGNGDRIRGIRPNIVIVDNFQECDYGALQNIYNGVAMSSGNPVNPLCPKWSQILEIGDNS